LIAILVRVGVKGENAVTVGKRLLKKFGGLSGLHRALFAELKSQHGIGEAKASQIKAAIELGRRLTLESPEEQPRGRAGGQCCTPFERVAVDCCKEALDHRIHEMSPAHSSIYIVNRQGHR
jgi:DNA repair protein RadC